MQGLRKARRGFESLDGLHALEVELLKQRNIKNMEQIQELNQATDKGGEIKAAAAVTPLVRSKGEGRALPQATVGLCPSCGTAVSSTANQANDQLGYVYAMGRIKPEFPSAAVEKERNQVLKRELAEAPQEKTKLKTEQAADRFVLSKRHNRYLAWQVCWVFSVKDVPTYILVPRDPGEIDLLVSAIRPGPDTDAVDVVIGVRGPIARPEMCKGLTIPILYFDQIYSFDRPSLMGNLVESFRLRKDPKDGAPKDPELAKISETDFRESAEEMFDRIMTLADNAGAMDEHRAINYLSVRSDEIYIRNAVAQSQGKFLTAQETRPSQLGWTRSIDVIFAFTNKTTDVVEKFITQVDVAGEFPFLVTKLSPCYDRWSVEGARV
jgi:hypothetical protein